MHTFNFPIGTAFVPSMKLLLANYRAIFGTLTADAAHIIVTYFTDRNEELQMRMIEY